MPITGSASTIWSANSLTPASSPSGLGRHKQARSPGKHLPKQPGQTSPESDLTEPQHAAIKCRACRSPITADHCRIEMAGNHGHRVVNPHGNEFLIGCFNQASGCLPAGQPYRLHSWFPGYQWQIALCRHCGAHLGWYFSQAGEDSFYALIFNRMTD